MSHLVRNRFALIYNNFFFGKKRHVAVAKEKYILFRMAFQKLKPVLKIFFWLFNKQHYI